MLRATEILTIKQPDQHGRRRYTEDLFQIYEQCGHYYNRSTHHIGNGGCSGSLEIGSELLCADRYKHGKPRLYGCFNPESDVPGSSLLIKKIKALPENIPVQYFY